MINKNSMIWNLHIQMQPKWIFSITKTQISATAKRCLHDLCFFSSLSYEASGISCTCLLVIVPGLGFLQGIKLDQCITLGVASSMFWKVCFISVLGSGDYRNQPIDVRQLDTSYINKPHNAFRHWNGSLS